MGNEAAETIANVAISFFTGFRLNQVASDDDDGLTIMCFHRARHASVRSALDGASQLRRSHLNRLFH
jgi:hypothetical protein